MELNRASSRAGSSAGGDDGGRRSISGLQQQSMPGISTEVWDPARAAAAQNAPGCTILYRGIDQARISGLFADDGTLSNIDTLLSPPPTDFSGRLPMFYFTPDVRVAEYYAAYAKRRTNCESVVILELRIPNAVIETLSEPRIKRLYWPSSEWKELVWSCRNRRKLPSHLTATKDAILIIGSRKPNHVYGGLSTWQDITEDFLLRIQDDGRPGGNGRIAIQYVISGQEEGVDWLIENGGRDIKALPYPQSALQRLVGEGRS
ncbi:hypothetical protein GE09DRAFT_232634 [Coniochaeta sp. 2T2.1]|nr:hypothetical protein GE09DRAFT_232634 [Coniochaeta sp. 2T2.1]